MSCNRRKGRHTEEKRKRTSRDTDGQEHAPDRNRTAPATGQRAAGEERTGTAIRRKKGTTETDRDSSSTVRDRAATIRMDRSRATIRTDRSRAIIRMIRSRATIRTGHSRATIRMMDRATIRAREIQICIRARDTIRSRTGEKGRSHKKKKKKHRKLIFALELDLLLVAGARTVRICTAEPCRPCESEGYRGQQRHCKKWIPQYRTVRRGFP